ncbi:double-stranded RNA-specific editase 1 isoform X2 [Drosophila tropicalis]
MPKPFIIVKEEPMGVEINPLANVDSVSVSDYISEMDGGKIPFKKIFQKRKKSSERTRDKKQRQNRQLRKSILPKNALMALNEVKGINISDFTINSNADGGFTAIVTVNSNQYEGKGQSKMAAKNLACEKALRDYIIAKMTPKPKKLKQKQPPQPVEQVPPPAPSIMVEHMDTNENADDDEEGENETEIESPEDELPMLNLASFAIYKLFAEWERQGYVVPEMHPNAANAMLQQMDPNAAVAAMSNAPPTAPKEPKKPPMRNELPPNWESMHPATLLCIMRPGITYVDNGCCGEKPNVLQSLSVTVDNQEFTATGRSKKIARRNVAVNVCNTLFGTKFDCEEY